MMLSLKATPSGWSTETAIQHENPIVTDDDGEPPSEEEEEEKYSHEVRLRVSDFKRHGLTTECPGCIRIRRGAKPPYRHNDVCKKRMYARVNQIRIFIYQKIKTFNCQFKFFVIKKSFSRKHYF